MCNGFKRKADFFALLDEIRWENPNNYDEINYSHEKELSPDEKLLTHWICYISDRAMGYKLIWDVGGFVYSDLVFHFRNTKTIEDLLKPDCDNSLFISIKPNKSKKKKAQPEEGEEAKEDEDKKYLFKSRESVGNTNIISKRYASFVDENKKVRFSPRYYPSDYVSIYYTLFTLDKLFARSFVGYIAEIIKKAMECSKNENIETQLKTILMCLFCGFYILSYSNIGQPTSSKLKDPNKLFADDNKNKLIELSKDPEKRAKTINDWLETDDFIEKATAVYDKKRFTSKRIWCCIRDYLKHTNKGNGFSELMESSLRQLEQEYNSEEYTNAVNLLFSDDMKTLLELPGDTWNNKSFFRHCLLKDDAEESTNASINKVLREKYDNKETTVYPEQFDVSFSFVPRMCEQGNCKYCPLSSKENNEIEKLCSPKKEQYCPAVLMYTGFIYECPGKEECQLKDFIK